MESAHVSMEGWEVGIRLLAGILLTAANAFFVVTEFALTRLRQFDEGEMGDHPGLRRAWSMTGELEIYLTGCQLGITTSSILLGVIAEPAMTALMRPLGELAGLSDHSLSITSVVLALVVINLVHKIWGEQAPTYLGVERPLEVLRWGALPLFWWVRVTKPVIYLGDGLAKATLRLVGVEISRSWTEAEEAGDDEAEDDETEAEGEKGRTTGPVASHADLLREMGELLSRGRIDHERREEILAAVEIGRLPVRDIMVPRDEIIALDARASIRENLRILRESSLARLPVRDGERFVGFVYVPALLRHLDALRAGELSFAQVAVEPFVVRADTPVATLIDRLQDVHQEMALVREAETDEIVGLVTATDAFEAIIGDLEDPFD